MALVDYSSESDTPSPSAPKRRKTSGGVPVPVRDAKTEEEGKRCHRHDADDASSPPQPGEEETTRDKAPSPPTSSSDLPPLPDEFYDLYASTVRTSVVDDPKLHQGRKRLIPHVAGNWPSHLYIEWHPTFQQHAALVSLLTTIQTHLPTTTTTTPLTSFLTSDLGAPLPLHVSLSRPIVLTTPTKDVFLERIASSVRSSGIHPFRLAPRCLAWYSSPDSNRTFLILRVVSSSSSGELPRLLRRCNALVAAFDQPVLYPRLGEKGDDDAVDEDAFHVSLAWTFDVPRGDAAEKSLRVLEGEEHAGIKGWEIEVNGIKAKIGNAVTHIGLPERAVDRKDRNLFGW